MIPEKYRLLRCGAAATPKVSGGGEGAAPLADVLKATSISTTFEFETIIHRSNAFVVRTCFPRIAINRAGIPGRMDVRIERRRRRRRKRKVDITALAGHTAAAAGGRARATGGAPLVSHPNAAYVVVTQPRLLESPPRAALHVITVLVTTPVKFPLSREGDGGRKGSGARSLPSFLSSFLRQRGSKTERNLICARER